MPASELTTALQGVSPGRALDIACGRGRHSIWLRDHGWAVTALDIAVEPMAGVAGVQLDLERGGFTIAPNSWDLIVTWLYWQPDLLPTIRAGVSPGGIVALAGKTTGRFATSLENYRTAFAGWEEIDTGEDSFKAFFIARRPATVNETGYLSVRIGSRQNP